MAKDNNEFEVFKGEFAEYQKRFGLTGYKIFYEHKPFGDDFGGISIDLDAMTVTVRLNSKLPKREETDKDVRRTAKHEACHLLLGRLYELAKYRYATHSEIYEAAEEVVNKLEVLIP